MGSGISSTLIFFDEYSFPISLSYQQADFLLCGPFIATLYHFWRKNSARSPVEFPNCDQALNRRAKC